MVAVLNSRKANVFSEDQLVSGVQQACAPRQRALLSLLAICNKHHLAPASLVASFAKDLPRSPLEERRKTRKFYWSRTHEFSEELKQSPAIPDALEKFPGLLPGTVELALRLAQEAGTLDEFNEAWLNRSPDYVCDATRTKTSVNSMFSLMLKTLFMVLVAYFIFDRVFPELEAMTEEFGVELPPVFDFAAMILDELAKFWFIPAVLFLIAILFCIPALSRYFKRWNPFVWQQPISPGSVSRRQILALVTAHGKSISAKALTGSWKSKRGLNHSEEKLENACDKLMEWKPFAARRIISANEAAALKLSDSYDTQAWLLRKSSVATSERVVSRRVSFARAIVTIVNVLLGVSSCS